MKKLRTGRKKTNYKVLTRMLFATAAFAYALPHWIFLPGKGNGDSSDEDYLDLHQMRVGWQR